MSFTSWLSLAEKESLLEAAQAAGFTSNYSDREWLLADMPAGWRDLRLPALPGQYVGSMADRIRQDLEVLNGEEPLADGTVLLVIWLRNAFKRSDAAGKRQARNFCAALDLCRARAETELAQADPADPEGWAQAVGFIDNQIGSVAVNPPVRPSPSPPQPGKLTGAQMARLVEIMTTAFDRNALQQLLLFRLNKQYDLLAPAGGNLKADATAVVTTALQEGWLPDLLQALRDERPLRSDLQRELGEMQATLSG